MSTQVSSLLIENQKNAGALVAAIKQGRLRLLVYPREISQFEELATKGQVSVGGVTVTPPNALLQTLVALVKFNTLTLMSLFRQGGSRHTKGRAIDISGYAGFNIDLRSPSATNAENAIKCITKILENLPLGKYYLGLPRPKGGSARDPENDVFLPVGPDTKLRVSPTGSFRGDIQLVKEKARQAIQATVNRNPRAKIVCLYPDAADHLHLDIMS